MTLQTTAGRPIVALDADGVLLDYHAGYRDAWARAFGEPPALRDRDAYWPMDRSEVRRLVDQELAQFRACFDEGFWSTIPAIEGAVDACHALRNAGFHLVCVSAVHAEFRDARLRNLQAAGFPIAHSHEACRRFAKQSCNPCAHQTCHSFAFQICHWQRGAT